jgi:hypothetical protein
VGRNGDSFHRDPGNRAARPVLLLDSTQISDAGVKHLSKLRQLRRLYLRYTQVTGSGLEQLAGLTNLERLDLMGSRGITSEALLALPNRENLESLNLLYTGIDRTAFAHLRTMSHLQELSVSDSAGSPADFVSLRRALPKTTIDVAMTSP